MASRAVGLVSAGSLERLNEKRRDSQDGGKKKDERLGIRLGPRYACKVHGFCGVMQRLDRPDEAEGDIGLHTIQYQKSKGRVHGGHEKSAEQGAVGGGGAGGCGTREMQPGWKWAQSGAQSGRQEDGCAGC